MQSDVISGRSSNISVIAQEQVAKAIYNKCKLLVFLCCLRVKARTLKHVPSVSCYFEWQS